MNFLSPGGIKPPLAIAVTVIVAALGGALLALVDFPADGFPAR